MSFLFVWMILAFYVYVYAHQSMIFIVFYLQTHIEFFYIGHRTFEYLFFFFFSPLKPREPFETS